MTQSLVHFRSEIFKVLIIGLHKEYVISVDHWFTMKIFQVLIIGSFQPAYFSSRVDLWFIFYKIFQSYDHWCKVVLKRWKNTKWILKAQSLLATRLKSVYIYLNQTIGPCMQIFFATVAIFALKTIFSNYRKAWLIFTQTRLFNDNLRAHALTVHRD